MRYFNFILFCFFHLSCTVHQAETSRSSEVIRWRWSQWKPGRWLPGHCHRGLAPAALPSIVWPEGSQWGWARADWRLPQDTLPRYGPLWKHNCSDPVFCFLHIHTVRMSSKTHMDLFGVCRFRFSPRALSCGARTTSVPWKTGHSHGQDLTRFGGVS